ncbi:MAG TPA: ATP-binding protein [Thermoanaerobaculia bacterium]|nr:ATP-binding protein [Thermoanaerobaculia bacterium]
MSSSPQPQTPDPAERVPVEELLRRSQENLQFIADATPVNIAHCSASCHFLFVNRAYAARFGLTPDQVVGRPIAEVLGQAAYEAIRPYVDRVLTGERFEFETEIDYRDIGRRYMHVAYTPEIGAEGKVVSWVASVTDLTDRHRLEEALREADRRKDEFLATLAHELRNPLAPIRNAVHLARVKGPPDPNLRWAQEVIERQVQQLTRLVDDLLDVSRITRGKIDLRRERVELSAVIERAMETSRPLIEAAGHRLTVIFPERRLLLDADPTRVSQVLSNLLNNAAKYTSDGGHIELIAGQEGEEAVIRVRDDGIGIPKEMLGLIFEMFTQVDTSLERAQGGLGIGLTIARRLVEMHGGTLEAASEGPGRGSELTVRLPLAPAETAGPDLLEDEGAAKAGAARRILVVDDNLDSAESLGMLLQIMGHDVRVAHDGLRALEVAAEHRPEVVLLDIGMPGMNGYDVARRLREWDATRSSLLVAMTGWGQDEDRRRSKEAGFDHHLVKPLDPKSLEGLLATPPRSA